MLERIMTTRLIAIGNSKGVRLPNPLLLQAGLTDELELSVKDGAIVIPKADSSPWAGWAKAAQELRERGEELLLEPFRATSFDEKEWEC
jgi:antitoxin MazE